MPRTIITTITDQGTAYRSGSTSSEVLSQVKSDIIHCRYSIHHIRALPDKQAEPNPRADSKLLNIVRAFGQDTKRQGFSSLFTNTYHAVR